MTDRYEKASLLELEVLTDHLAAHPSYAGVDEQGLFDTAIELWTTRQPGETTAHQILTRLKLLQEPR